MIVFDLAEKLHAMMLSKEGEANRTWHKPIVVKGDGNIVEIAEHDNEVVLLSEFKD